MYKLFRGTFTEAVKKKYNETSGVLKEFLENDDFVTRYNKNLEKEFESVLETIENGLDGGPHKKEYQNLKKLGIKEFGERAVKAIKKIKANDDPINIADLKIFEHLSGHRKVASDVIRKLRDDKLSVGDGKFVVESGKKSECEGFLIQLGIFRRSLFPGDVEFKEMVDEAKAALQNNMVESQKRFEGFFREKGIFDSQSRDGKYIINDVGTNITMPKEEEVELLLSIASDQDRSRLKTELMDLMQQQVDKKVQLMLKIRNHALEKFPKVISQSSDIRVDLINYLQLDEENFQKAQALIETLEKFGGRKDNLPPEEWDFILQNLRQTEERQHAKEMVRAYIMRSERVVDQFIAQRGNINVRNDELRVRGIDLNDKGVKHVLAKLERAEEIDRNELALISKGVDQTENGLKDFTDRMCALSNNDYINIDQNLSHHNEKIKKILSLENIDEHQALIEKLRSLGGMVDNLTEEEWGRLLPKVVENDKDRVKEELIKLIRDFEEGLDEKAQPEYRKILTASQVTLVDDYAAIEIKRAFKGFKERKKIPNRKESAAAKVVDEDKNKKASIDEMIGELTARVALLEAEKESDKAEIKKLQDARNELEAITTDQLKVIGLDEISELSEEIDFGIRGNSLGRSSRSTSSAISSKGFFPLNGGNEGNNSEHGIGLQGVGYNPISSDRQRQNPFPVTYNGWTQEQQLPFININVPGYGVGGYGDPSNIGPLLAQQTEGLKKEIEDTKAAVLRLEASAIEATKKTQKEIEDTRAANQKLIEANQKKNEDKIAANKKEYDDKMAEMAKKEKEAKEREEKRKEAMEPDWNERNVSYEDLEKSEQYSDDGSRSQEVSYRNPISSDRQRQNPFPVTYNGWTQEQQLPFININVPGYGVGGYGDLSNLAHSTKGLEGKIEELKAAFSRSEAAAKEAETKAKREIQDANAASLQRVNEAISSSQQKANDAIAANKKENADKMAEIANKTIADAKAAKEREERRKNAMEPDWDERDVAYEELEKIGHLSDGDGLAVISEIRGQKKGKLGEEGYFPGMITYKNGSSVAVYDGRNGLEKFTREVEQSAAKDWSGKNGRPIASIARIDNLEKEGDTIFCLATASPSGTTKTFISPEIYREKINSIADVEYEMALSGAVRIKALTKYVAALKEAAEKVKIAQPLNVENLSDDGSIVSLDDSDEAGSVLSVEEDFTDNESILSDSDYSPKEDIENEIARIEEVLNNMNAVYKGHKGITRKDKKQYLEDMWYLNPMDSDLMNLLKEQDKKLGNKLERLENSVFAPQEISVLTQDATRVKKEFARLHSAQETNRSIGDLVEKSAEKNKLSVDLDSEEIEKFATDFSNKQTTLPSGISVPADVAKGVKQAFDLRKSAYETLLEQPIQHAPLEGISILRPRGTGNVATVCFEGNARKDIAYLYVPETDYIISVRRAKYTGKVASYEGGPMVDCVANEIIIPKDTVFKLVEGKHVAVSLDSLSKRDREFYDNFQVKAMSNVDGQRKMTTLFKGKVSQYNDLDKKIAYDINSDQVIKFEVTVTATDGHLLEKKIEGAEKVGERYVIQIGSITGQFGNTLVDLKGVLAPDPNNKGGLLIEGPYIEQKDGTAKLLDQNSLKELYADLGVTNPKHQKTFAEIMKEISQTKVMATIVKDGQEHLVKLPITNYVTPSTVVKEAMIAGQMGHTIQNSVRFGRKDGGGRGAG